MRLARAILAAAFLISACSDRNLVGEVVPDEEVLAAEEMGFGRNSYPEDDDSRFVDVTLYPDNRYEIVVGSYRSPGEPEVSSFQTGSLSPSAAAALRHRLAELRPAQGSGYHVGIPGCPEVQPASPDYYAGFKRNRGEPDVIAIYDACETTRGEAARNIVTDAFKAIPGLNHMVF